MSSISDDSIFSAMSFLYHQSPRYLIDWMVQSFQATLAILEPELHLRHSSIFQVLSESTDTQLLRNTHDQLMNYERFVSPGVPAIVTIWLGHLVVGKINLLEERISRSNSGLIALIRQLGEREDFSGHFREQLRLCYQDLVERHRLAVPSFDEASQAYWSGPSAENGFT
jgi:hypothetical protein